VLEKLREMREKLVTIEMEMCEEYGIQYPFVGDTRALIADLDVYLVQQVEGKNEK
jgi:hypothetical protein